MTVPYESGVLTLHSAAVADANGTIADIGGFATASVQLYGTYTSATVYFEGTVDGTNYIGLLGWNRTTGVKALTATAVGLYMVDVTGLAKFRVRLDWTSGSCSAAVKFSSLPTTTLVTAS